MSKITRRGFVKTAALAPLALSSLNDMAQASVPADRAGTSDRFDIVVAGAGHNSMIAAAYLAKAGYRVVLLEGRPTVGGGVKTAQFTLRGFKHDTCSSAHNAIQDNPLMRDDEIELGDYGLEYIYPDPVYPHAVSRWQLHHAVARPGPHLSRNLRNFRRRDAATYRRMFARIRIGRAPIFEAVTFAPIGFGKSLNDRLAEHPRGKYWQRRTGMSPGISSATISRTTTAALHAGLAPARSQPVSISDDGPDCLQSFPAATPQPPIPKGGSGALTEALARFIEAHGGVILTNKPVQRLIVENGKCAGVECTDGSLVSRRQSRAFHDPHQATSGHGAARIVGPRFHRRGEYVAGRIARRLTPITPPRNLRSTPFRAARSRRCNSALMSTARTRAALCIRLSHSVWSISMTRRCMHLPAACRSDASPGGNAHRQGSRLPTLRYKGRPSALGRDQGPGRRRESEIPASVCAESDRRQDPCAKSIHSPLDIERENPITGTAAFTPVRRARRSPAPCARCPAGHSTACPSPALSDRRMHLSRWFSHGSARPQRGRGDAQGFWHQHRGSDQERNLNKMGRAPSD